MNRLLFFVLCLSVLAACGPSPEKIAGQTADAKTAIAALWSSNPIAYAHTHPHRHPYPHPDPQPDPHAHAYPHRFARHPHAGAAFER